MPSPLFDPSSQADAFGPLSAALGDPEATDPHSFGMPGAGAKGTFLGMLMELLQKLGAGGGVAPMPTSPRSFMSEGPSGR